MKNRERLLRQNEYDLLIGLQAAIGSGLCQCVIEALTAKEYTCPDDKVCMLSTCEKCIQEWLNKESERNDSERTR